MSALLRWFWEWHRERQLFKETEAREPEKRTQQLKEMQAREEERRIQLKKQCEQQTRVLHLTLERLQNTMDPLMATQAYNNYFCPLTRLPEELCLCILNFLRDDAVTLHCLRQVSRTFLRLLNRQSGFWDHTWYDSESRPPITHPCFLHDSFRLPLRRLLQRDGRCDNCRHWNEVQRLEYHGDSKFQQNSRDYGDSDFRRLYCDACDSLHDVLQFSSANQQPRWGAQQERRCLGQQGSVQLCEHMQIAWASIKAHIDNWRQQQRELKRGVEGGGEAENLQTCLDSFLIECHDASHNTRCTTSEAPTWPRACLRTGRGVVLLSLEWTPHSRFDIDTLAVTPDGRIQASELRTLFQRLRQVGPADILYPPARPGTLPEIAYFSPLGSLAPLIHYEIGNNDRPLRPFLSPPPTAAVAAAAAPAGLPTTPTPPPSFPLLPPDELGSPWWWLRCWKMTRFSGNGRDEQKLAIKPHYLTGTDDAGISRQCLVVNYRKDIMICKTTAVADPTVKIVPTDQWLHVMDPDTYQHPWASHLRPQCKDVACTNYYRRRRR